MSKYHHMHVLDVNVLKTTGYTCWKCYEADQESKHKNTEKYEEKVEKINELLWELEYLKRTRKQLKLLLRRMQTSA